MPVSVRSYLMAGAAAATATAIALTPVQVLPADVAVPAHLTSADQSHLTKAMIKLLAAAGTLPAAATSQRPAASVAPTVGTTPLAAVPGVGPQNAASDWLTGAYQGIQAWVDWGVTYGTDIAYWLAGWGVPFAYTIGAQTNIFYWSLIRPVSDNIFYQAVVPIVNDPLNLGVWVSGIGNAIRSSIPVVVNFGIAEFNYFFGWILPPLPPVPPNWPAAAAASAQPLAAAEKTALTALPNPTAALIPISATLDQKGKVDPTSAGQTETPAASDTSAKAETPAKTDPTTANTAQAGATDAGTTSPKTTDSKSTDPRATEPTTGDPKTADPKGDTPKSGSTADKGDGSATGTHPQGDNTSTKPADATTPSSDKTDTTKTDTTKSSASADKGDNNTGGTQSGKGGKAGNSDTAGKTKKADKSSGNSQSTGAGHSGSGQASSDHGAKSSGTD
ncbi:MAG: hypothetical protein P4L86_26315 [Mycobacterium sp.]|nr:hypothetical protein [Mycobacterium sp.]